jgi:hypothetical protein
LDRVGGLETRNEYEISVGKFLYRRLFGIPWRMQKNKRNCNREVDHDVVNWIAVTQDQLQ